MLSFLSPKRPRESRSNAAPGGFFPAIRKALAKPSPSRRVNRSEALRMRKGLRFQTKLMATLVTAITAISLALVLFTENKVSQTYTRQFSREFTHLVKQLEESSEERSQDFLELSAKLAAHPFIAASLAGTETPQQSRDFWKEYLKSLGLVGALDETSPLKRPDLPGIRGQTPQ